MMIWLRVWFWWRCIDWCGALSEALDKQGAASHRRWRKATKELTLRQEVRIFIAGDDECLSLLCPSCRQARANGS